MSKQDHPTISMFGSQILYEDCRSSDFLHKLLQLITYCFLNNL